MDDSTPRKMSPTEIREFDLKERWRAEGLTPIELSYNDMRRLTIALHNEGHRMKHQHLSFAHGSIGNEILALSQKIDNMVADMEPRHLVLLTPEIRTASEDKRRAEQVGILRNAVNHWQDFCSVLSKLLGCENQDQAIIVAVDRLVTLEKSRKKSKK
jgi:hypothetical protein